MTTYFVTRHPGARDWAARRGLADAVPVTHLDPAAIQRGDTVIGTLPIHLVAEVVARGGRYFHLILDLEASDRGKPLTAEDMDRLGARLVAMTASFL